MAGTVMTGPVAPVWAKSNKPANAQENRPAQQAAPETAATPAPAAGETGSSAADATASAQGDSTAPVQPADAPIANVDSTPAADTAPDASGQNAGDNAVSPAADAATAGNETLADPAPAIFDPQMVIDRAQELAKQPFENPHRELPEALASLSAEDYAKIRFKSQKAFFSQAKSGFALDLYHPGNVYDVPVVINLVRDGQVQTVPYSAGLFDFGETGLAGTDFSTQGYAGFRLRYPLGDVIDSDELASFLGASYFRFQGGDQVPGQMARGLAIDLAGPAGEEVPVFREFWIVAPKEGEHKITVHALLDSARVTGAYRFDISPGKNSRIEVSSSLFFRGAVDKIGIAPMNSMFLYGEQKRRNFDDYRGEVHASDGLLINNGWGEWLWRPLDNPANLQISSFMDENPRGFGLLQRDRNFDHYQDLDARFDRQPGYWVRPKGDWGKGHVELVEIPSPNESNDNIVAFWVPENKPDAGQRWDMSYDISATSAGTELHRLAQVTDTRIMTVPGGSNQAAVKRFVLNFAGGDLDYYLSDTAGLSANISASNADIRNIRVIRDGENGGARVMFDLVGNGDAASSDLRAFLQYRDQVLSETWTMPWVF